MVVAGTAAMSARFYVDHIEQALGIATLGKTRVQFGTFDFGRMMGVAIEFPSGARQTVKVDFTPGWEDRAISELLKLAAAKPELLRGAI